MNWINTGFGTVGIGLTILFFCFWYAERQRRKRAEERLSDVAEYVESLEDAWRKAQERIVSATRAAFDEVEKVEEE